jgi:hypothetical protein
VRNSGRARAGAVGTRNTSQDQFFKLELCLPMAPGLLTSFCREIGGFVWGQVGYADEFGITFTIAWLNLPALFAPFSARISLCEVQL